METFRIRRLGTTVKFTLVNFSWEPPFPVIAEAGESDLEIYLFRDGEGSLINRAKKNAARRAITKSFRDIHAEIFDIEKRRTFCFFRKGISPDFMIERETVHSFMVFQDLLDIIFLHAASVVMDNKAYLFVAPSGGGKTTMSSLAMENGLHVLDDESCLVKRSGGRFFTGRFPAGIFGRLPSKTWEIGGVFFLNKAERDASRGISIIDAIRRAMPEATCIYRNRVPGFRVSGNRSRIFHFLEEMFTTAGISMLDFTKGPEVLSCIRQTQFVQ